MADDQDKASKTEEPTDKKLRDAMEKGNVPTSKEAATMGTFIAMFIGGSFFLSGSVSDLSHTLARFIDNPGAWRIRSGADAVALMQLVSGDIASLLAPMILLLVVAGVASSLLQNQPRIAGQRIKPEASKISLIKGFGRIFGMQGLVEFGKSVFKVSAVAAVGFAVVSMSKYEVLASLFLEPVVLPSLLQDVILRLIGWIVLLSTVLVAADIAWTRYKWRADLRMTKQEVKDELKQTQGDPMVKQRVRSLARDRARRRMISAVPRATVVITNPTHYAVALRYVREEGGAPLVLAKGTDLIALKIREIAEEHDVPIIEDKPLARSLYDSVEIEKFIPPQFYRAVAEIIYYLHLGKQKPTGRIKS